MAAGISSSILMTAPRQLLVTCCHALLCWPALDLVDKVLAAAQILYWALLSSVPSLCRLDKAAAT